MCRSGENWPPGCFRSSNINESSVWDGGLCTCLKGVLEKILCPLSSRHTHCPAPQSTDHLASWISWITQPLSPAFNSIQSLPLDPHGPLHTDSLSCSSSTQPMTCSPGDHPPSLHPCISAPGCLDSHSLFLGSLSTKPQPTATPHNLIPLTSSPRSPLSPAPGQVP